MICINKLPIGRDKVSLGNQNFEAIMSRVKLAVVGNGMVGHRFIEDLLDKADKDQFEITVFCEEPRIAYDRVHLSSYFSHHTAEELSLVREGFTKSTA